MKLEPVLSKQTHTNDVNMIVYDGWSRNQKDCSDRGTSLRNVKCHRLSITSRLTRPTHSKPGIADAERMMGSGGIECLGFLQTVN